MSKPTIAEQIAAVAMLRNFTKLAPRFVNPTAGELAIVEAINILDDADLFADLDQERDAAEITQEDRTP
jgi:hypothetical protein